MRDFISEWVTNRKMEYLMHHSDSKFPICKSAISAKLCSSRQWMPKLGSNAKEKFGKTLVLLPQVSSAQTN